MALHLVGETIDKHKAHAAAQAGALVALYRGIYVDAGDDIDRTVMDHAVRIATYLYPRAYLSGASAARLAPTPDGRLFLSARRVQRTRIRTLEIIQNQGPTPASTLPVVVGDDMGEIRLTASSLRQRFLEAFRLRSEHAGAIDPDLRRAMADRLIEEYGTGVAAADALIALGRETGWLREAGAADLYLRTGARPDVKANAAALDLTVGWHGEAVGRLSHNGAEWRWTAATGTGPPLIRETRPGSLPPFIESLLPEGWLARVLNTRDDRETLRTGRRYMSNITIVDRQAALEGLPPDILLGRLAHFQDQGAFTGRYLGPLKRKLEDDFQANLAREVRSERTPRLSGIQIKAPMNLSRDGDLTLAADAPFTHIFKPAGTNGFEALPIVEWFCLNLARTAGFEVPEVALVAMPEGMAPALLVERFDIRRSENDSRRIAMEDFCSVLDLPADAKYDQTIERMARGLRPLSTRPTEDLEILFRRAVFAWLIADGDMHLKNLALLKSAEPGESRFGSVRFAPVYDAVTTVVFPGLEDDKMAFMLSGKNSRLTPNDFLNTARTIDLPVHRASELMADCARRVVAAVPDLAMPPPFADRGDRMRDRIAEIVQRRAEPFV